MSVAGGLYVIACLVVGLAVCAAWLCLAIATHDAELQKKADAWEAEEDARQRAALAEGRPFIRNWNPYEFH